MPIRTLIVDDEPLARQRLRTLLQREPDMEIVGECADGAEAIGAIERLAPALVFLDVQMPEVDGFDVLAAIGVDRMPVVVFVTAYDRYALRAFDAEALDYLLKPYAPSRFRRTLARVREQLARADQALALDRRLVALLEGRRRERGVLERLAIRAAGRIHFVRASEIDWIEAADNYVRLHAGAETHLLRETMRSLEAKLDPPAFLRIHRSIIVRVDRIKEVQPWFRGGYVVLLRDGTRLTSSHRYDGRLRAFLDNRV